MKNRKWYSQSAMVIAVAGTLLFGSGCSSILSKSEYPINIKTEPDKADFVVKDEDGTVFHKGKTPEVVVLKASEGYYNGAEYVIEISREGYLDEKIYLNASLDGSFWGNLLLGGIIGMVFVDPATGAMWELADVPVKRLVPDQKYLARKRKEKMQEIMQSTKLVPKQDAGNLTPKNKISNTSATDNKLPDFLQ